MFPVSSSCLWRYLSKFPPYLLVSGKWKVAYGQTSSATSAIRDERIIRHLFTSQCSQFPYVESCHHRSIALCVERKSLQFSGILVRCPAAIKSLCPSYPDASLLHFKHIWDLIDVKPGNECILNQLPYFFLCTESQRPRSYWRLSKVALLITVPSLCYGKLWKCLHWSCRNWALRLQKSKSAIVSHLTCL